jgi:hypothetical protein
MRSCSPYLSAMRDVNSVCIRSLLAPLRVAHMVRSMVSFLLANHGGRFVELCYWSGSKYYSTRHILQHKNLRPILRKKGNEKCTVLSSNECRVRKYYNTDLRRSHTSEHIKALNSIIQRVVNVIFGEMKINSQGIARPSLLPRSIYANHRQQF